MNPAASALAAVPCPRAGSHRGRVPGSLPTEKVKKSYYSNTIVLACGDNKYGQLGIARKLGESMGKVRVQQIRWDAVARTPHAAPLSQRPELHLVHAVRCTGRAHRYPAPVDAFRKVEISKLGAGARHSFAITTDGELYSWGYRYVHLCSPVG